MLNHKLGQNTNNISHNWNWAYDPYCYFECTQLWSLSEKLFHINLIRPRFSSFKLLLHYSGLDRSDRSVQRQFPRNPFSEKTWNFRYSSEVSTLVSEVPTSIALYLHYLHTILTLTWFYDDLDIFFYKYGATFFMYETTSSLK